MEQWGIYEAERLSEMPSEDFREFTLRAYGATRVGESDGGPPIHGWRNQFPIWVGDPDLDSQATALDVQDFANAIRRTVEYRDANLRDGIMLAWGFTQDARLAAEKLRQRESLDVNFVRLKMIGMATPTSVSTSSDAPPTRRTIASSSPSYSACSICRVSRQWRMRRHI